MTPRCLGCDVPLGPFCFDGLCYACNGGLVRDALFLRDGTPDQVKARVAWAQDQNCATLAKLIMGVVPFTPDAATVERVTNE